MTETQRIVPGAPPAVALSRSQLKKKRKVKAKTEEEASEAPLEIPDAKSAALVEQAPESSDVQAGTVAPQLVAEPSEPLAEELPSQKASPIIELVSKRLKTTNKKIVSLSNDLLLLLTRI